MKYALRLTLMKSHYYDNNGFHNVIIVTVMKVNEKWLQWAVELQSLAQSALYYCKDPYDQERFERIREISAEMISEQSDISLDKVKDLFCNEESYQTPK